MEVHEVLQKFRRGRKVRDKEDKEVLGEISGTAIKSRLQRGMSFSFLSVAVDGRMRTYSHHSLEVFNGKTKEWE